MENPGENSSLNQADDQPQMEVEFEGQAQEFQYEQVPDATATGDGFSASNYDQNQQVQYQQQQQPPNNIPQNPQPQPQVQVQGVFQQVQTQLPSQPQPARFPPPQGQPQPQPNLYRPPQSPHPYPPQSPQQFPPQQYPPQGQQFQPQQPQGYQQPQPRPAQFPPQSPNMQTNPNPVYHQQNPALFPPPGPSTPQKAQAYPPQPAVNYQTYQGQGPQVQFSQHQQPQQANLNGIPPPTYFNGQKDPNGAAQGIPMQQAPTHVNLMNAGTNAWSTELFDCMDDPMNAVTTAFVPCLTFGQIAEVVDNGTSSCAMSGLFYGLIAAVIGVPFIMSCTYRTKLRSMFGLMESPAPDWVTHLFCEPCALCQEYRELQIRGIDPSIGWMGNLQLNPNLQQQLRANMMQPPAYQNMNQNHMM